MKDSNINKKQESSLTKRIMLINPLSMFMIPQDVAKLMDNAPVDKINQKLYFFTKAYAAKKICVGYAKSFMI